MSHVQKSPKQSKQATPGRPEEEKYTIAEAFDYFHIPDDADPRENILNMQRAVRAVAFLLYYCSEMGTESAHAAVAEGLATACEKIADNFKYVDATIRRASAGKLL